ncbi:hypothetical protein V7S43_015701 [Phytophthora oleae]|uniref:Uncharacterized protein n=1 Tax=Phytophthora oleae TaxID=2107226 RepID=A0ABD3EY20_9STRA
MAWEVERICFVEVVKGCRVCEIGGARRTRAEWDAEVAIKPLSERERSWIARYETVLSNTRRAAASRGEAPRGHSFAARGHDRQSVRNHGDEQRGRSSVRERSNQGRKRRRSRSSSAGRRVRQRDRVLRVAVATGNSTFAPTPGVGAVAGRLDSYS